MKALALLLVCATAQHHHHHHHHHQHHHDQKQPHHHRHFTGSHDPTASDFTCALQVDPVLPARRRVVAFADVHGDLGALTVLLRDLAKVVRFSDASLIKRPDVSREAGAGAEEDGQAGIPRAGSSGDHQPHQDVEWIGGDTVVVSTGDVVDRYRPGFSVLDDKTGRGEGEVDGEEKKILELLNTVATKAAEAGGALVRLIGNHEMMNLDGQTNYATPHALQQQGGAAGRQAWFRPGSGEGVKRLACGGLAIFRVGHWTFAHGGLMPELAQILKDAGGIPRANEVMQRTLLGSTDGSTDGLADKLFQGKEALMWERRQSDSQRAPDCGQTREALETSGAAVGKRNRLVMGHTPQFNGVSEGSYNFRHPPATDDDERDSAGGAGAGAGSGASSAPQGHAARLAFVGPGRLLGEDEREAGAGINFACPFLDEGRPGSSILASRDSSAPSDGALWRLDVGMSRAFDRRGAFRTLGQRRPSALEILHLGDSPDDDEYEVRVLVAASGLPRTWCPAGQDQEGVPAFLAKQPGPLPETVVQ